MALLARVAAAAAAEGDPLVDLGRGNPEVGPPAHVIDALQRSAARPDAHGYAPFAGLPELKEAIAARYLAVYGVSLDPAREVAVVPGSKTALMEFALVAVERGETILLPDPGYADYPSAVALAGAQRLSVESDGCVRAGRSFPRGGWLGRALTCMGVARLCVRRSGLRRTTAGELPRK